MNRVWSVALVGIALVAVGLFVDHYSRCYRRPISREEALRRSNDQLQHLSRDFALGADLPILVEEQYEPDKNTWIFTFRSSTCEVSIIADRCHGTDVGGMSSGCKERRGSR